MSARKFAPSSLRYLLARASRGEVASLAMLPPRQRFLIPAPGAERVEVAGEPSPHCEGLLVAFDRSGRIVHASQWASSSVALQWLARPTLRGLPLAWYGAAIACGAPASGADWGRP